VERPLTSARKIALVPPSNVKRTPKGTVKSALLETDWSRVAVVHFIRDRDAALREEILNTPKAQTEMVVQPDGVADDFGRKSISAVARRVASH
jgi:hypothetical protein